MITYERCLWTKERYFLPLSLAVGGLNHVSEGPIMNKWRHWQMGDRQVSVFWVIYTGEGGKSDAIKWLTSFNHDHVVVSWNSPITYNPWRNFFSQKVLKPTDYIRTTPLVGKVFSWKNYLSPNTAAQEVHRIHNRRLKRYGPSGGALRLFSRMHNK